MPCQLLTSRHKVSARYRQSVFWHALWNGESTPIDSVQNNIFVIWTRFTAKHTIDDFKRAERKCHDDVIKWKLFPRYWPFVWGIHRSPVNSPHKGLWRGAMLFSLICAWISSGVNNREAGDLRRHRAHYDVTVMNGFLSIWFTSATKLKKLW